MDMTGESSDGDRLGIQFEKVFPINAMEEKEAADIESGGDDIFMPPAG